MKTPIRIKLGLLIGILLLFILVVGLTAYFQASRVNEKVNEIAEVEHKTSETAYQMEINLMGTSLAVLKYLQDNSKEHLTTIKEGEIQFAEFQNKYTALVQTEQIKQLGLKVESSHLQFRAAADSLIRKQDAQNVLKKSWTKEFERTLDILENETYEPEKRFDAHKDAKMRASLRVQAMKVNVNQLKNDLENYLKTHLNEYETAIQADKKDFFSNFNLQQQVARPDRKEKFAVAIKKSIKNIISLTDTVILMEKEKQRMLLSFESIQRKFSALLEEQVLLLANKNLLAAKDEAIQVSRKSNMVIGILLIITLLFGTITGIVFTRNITKPLKQLVGASKKIGETDFSQRVSIHSGDELEVLANSFNQMAAQLQIAKEKQAALLAEIEKSNKELEAFAHVVSHDLKAPLRGIHTLAEWLSAGFGDKLGPDGVEQLDLMRNRVKRMFAMIDGILQYSKIGKVEGEKEKIDMNKFVKEVVQFLAVPSHIEIKIQEDLPSILFESMRLHQVLQNLISNAVKYMDKPKGLIQINCLSDVDSWQFIISDNGPGIEARFLDKIFNLFQTIGQKDERESTGVGLAIVQKIVETAGGRVWVESKIGKGSNFYFTVLKSA